MPTRWQTPAQLAPSPCSVILLPRMSPILTSVVLGLTAAAANVFGGTVIVQRTWERRYLRYFVALGAGFMLATAMVEMVPESLALAGRKGALLILAGYLIVHLFEHTITPHFHYGEETHADEFIHSHKRMSVLVGLMIHTFFDGIAITSGLLASGLSKRRSWFASVMLGLATLAGVLTMAIGRHEVSYGLPVAAGVTIYVAASDLIPEVNREPGVRMALVVFVGVALLFILDQLFHLH